MGRDSLPVFKLVVTSIVHSGEILSREESFFMKVKKEGHATLQVPVLLDGVSAGLLVHLTVQEMTFVLVSLSVFLIPS